jgi:Zn-dependent peptidase ImmA (M78 family)
LGLFDVINAYGSIDAISCFNNKTYSIAYNSERYPVSRRLFSLAHEIGHIYLGHYTDVGLPIISALSKDEIGEEVYDILEKEANYFASHILAPDIFLQHSEITDVEKLMYFTGFSREAATNRLNSFSEFRVMSTEFDSQITSNLAGFCFKCIITKSISLNVLDMVVDEFF